MIEPETANTPVPNQSAQRRSPEDEVRVGHRGSPSGWCGAVVEAVVEAADAEGEAPAADSAAVAAKAASLAVAAAGEAALAVEDALASALKVMVDLSIWRGGVVALKHSDGSTVMEDSDGIVFLPICKRSYR